MKRDQSTLHSVGEALYGLNWQSAIARDLEIADRTVRRWASAETAIPDGVWPELAKLCKRRGAELEKIAAKLSSD